MLPKRLETTDPKRLLDTSTRSPVTELQLLDGAFRVDTCRQQDRMVSRCLKLMKRNWGRAWICGSATGDIILENGT